MLHPDAEQDLAGAALFYRREGGRALAARFLGAIGKLLALWFATRVYERTKARLNGLDEFDSKRPADRSRRAA